MYLSGIGYSIFLLCFFCLCALVYQYRKRGSNEERWVLAPSNPRILRACVLVYFVLYLELNKKSFAVLYCVAVGGGYYLNVEPSRPCFEGAHWPAFFFALAILSTAIAVPISMWYTSYPAFSPLSLSL